MFIERSSFFDGEIFLPISSDLLGNRINEVDLQLSFDETFSIFLVLCWLGALRPFIFYQNFFYAFLFVRSSLPVWRPTFCVHWFIRFVTSDSVTSQSIDRRPMKTEDIIIRLPYMETSNYRMRRHNMLCLLFDCDRYILCLTYFHVR